MIRSGTTERLEERLCIEILAVCADTDEIAALPRSGTEHAQELQEASWSPHGRGGGVRSGPWWQPGCPESHQSPPWIATLAQRAWGGAGGGWGVAEHNALHITGGSRQVGKEDKKAHQEEEEEERQEEEEGTEAEGRWGCRDGAIAYSKMGGVRPRTSRHPAKRPAHASTGGAVLFKAAKTPPEPSRGKRSHGNGNATQIRRVVFCWWGKFS